MKISKKIKTSKRGLTFSFDGFGEFCPGKKYRYILDKDNKKLLILPVRENEDGLKISRKKGNGKVKALFDLRNKDVLSVMESANYLDIEIEEERILITAMVKVEQKENGKVVSFSQSVRKLAAYQIPKTLLKASGGEDQYYQFSLEDIFGTLSEEFTVPVDDTVKKDLPDVLRVISLFSGAGMLDLPFARDKDFSIVYAVELDNDAVQTYRKNIGDHIHQMDVRKLKGKDLPAADIMIGGCPCQPYSRANPSAVKRGKEHEEGDLLMEYVRLVKETNVKMFVIENVPQFLTDSYGENMKYIHDNLDKDYEITAKVVCDSDLGGYTKRKRTIIFGSRLGKPVSIPDMKVFPVKTVGQALKKVHEGWKNFCDVTMPSEQTKYRISLIPEGGNWKDLPEELRTKGVHSNMYRRLDRNQPSVTICNWRKYLLSPPRYDDSGKWDRILSVAEAAALSGLDETFTFYGKLSSMQQMVGNGVPFSLGNFVKGLVKKAFGVSKEESVKPATGILQIV